MTPLRRQRRVVLTGGPGAGKTAALELAMRTFCRHVVFLPESAGILFGGGFPRTMTEVGECAAQRAICHVQRELETMADERVDAALVICDRGTLDGLAYWPRAPEEYLRELGTTRELELVRYDAVIHLHPPRGGSGYERSAIRVESASESSRIDARIVDAWSGHPRRMFVDSAPSFVEKMSRVLALLRAELPTTCASCVAATAAEARALRERSVTA